MIERRTARRYELSLPIVVRVSHVDPVLEYSGMTRDISVKCVHFILGAALSAGASIEFTIALPTTCTDGRRVFVRGGGQVLWVSGGPDNYGVAATVERYDISRDNEARSTNASDKGPLRDG